MYRINVSLFVSVKDYTDLTKFLRDRFLPLLQRDKGVVRVDIMDLIPEVSSLELYEKPIDDKVLALLITLYDEKDFNRFRSIVMHKWLTMLTNEFGERVLHHMSLMKDLQI